MDHQWKHGDHARRSYGGLVLVQGKQSRGEKVDMGQLQLSEVCSVLVDAAHELIGVDWKQRGWLVWKVDQR